MMRALVPLAVLLAACGNDTIGVDLAAPSEMGMPDLGAPFDMPAPLRGAFTIIGCATLDVSGGEPRCSGRAPLALTFVPLGSGVDSYLWTFAGGSPASTREVSPTVTFAQPGTYAISFAAGGAAGTTTASGTVIVTTGATGAPCLADVDCDASAGLSCICKPGEPGCTGGLAIGLCSRSCAGAPCKTGEICADLTHAGAYVPPNGGDGGVDGGGGSGSVWQQTLCLPACQAATDCRVGLACRALPAFVAGAPAGSFSWQRGCFADLLGDDGAPCADVSGAPTGALCLSGRCDPYGARGMCTSSCATSADCPPSAACAFFAAAPTAGRCLARCTSTPSGDSCVGNPALGCLKAGQPGGFTIVPQESAATTYCAQ
jgi:PKD repeat protein